MKPKTKAEKEVWELYQQLPPVLDNIKSDMLNCIPKHDVFYGKAANGYGKHHCTECGYIWNSLAVTEYTTDQAGNVVTVRCPNCGEVLTVIKFEDYKRNDYDDFIAVFDSAGGWQVIRLFYVIRQYDGVRKATMQSRLTKRVAEVGHIWTKNGKTCLLRGPKKPFAYMHRQVFSEDGGDWSFYKRNYTAYYYQAFELTDITPGRIVTLKKADFCKYLNFDICNGNLSPLRLMELAGNFPYVEVLSKKNQAEMIRLINRNANADGIAEIVNAIKLCQRHKYDIQAHCNADDAEQIYFDYLKMLVKLKKDLHNPKFICPPDIKAVHDECQRKINRLEEERQRQLRRERMERQEKDMEKIKKQKELCELYVQMRQQFLPIHFTTSNGINISVFQDVEQFMRVGIDQDICVFSAGYWNVKERPQTLIMGAVASDGHYEATIEIDLKQQKVVQCRGFRNRKPESYDEIVSTLNENMGVLSKASKQKAS